MERTKVALIGMGVIGTPIAHKLYISYKEDFYLIASGNRRKRLENGDITINGDDFKPNIISSVSEITTEINVLIVCVKNYDLKTAIIDLKNIITAKTIIIPLQNGIYAYEFFRRVFSKNIVLQGYIQGPNTEIHGKKIFYQNSGVIHIGSETDIKTAEQVYKFIDKSGMDIVLEEHINYMVWKKWMLNVAGNSITALTGADYSLFKLYGNLTSLCVNAMQEFLTVANAEGIHLNEKDINDVVNYYVSYFGSKKTSMLVDIQNERKTENDYLAGTLIRVAEKHNIKTPIISTLYYLLEVKEEVYMEKKGCITMENLFNENIEYSTSLRTCMKDIDNKMESENYAKLVNEASVPELLEILEYAIKNTNYYSSISKVDNPQITDFPIMNKTILNENYDDIIVHIYDNIKTHKMHTSGSTGIPFSVVQDLAKRERHIADLKYFGAMAGYLDHDPMCYLRAKPTATPEEQERDNIWQLDICNLSEKNLTDYFHTMVEKRCIALIAYPSTLETAVDFWSQHFSNDSSIKTIISTSETLIDEVKDKLRNFFGENVGIYARYSNTENGILGQETGVSGIYRLNWASYYFEILKMDCDEPAELGELGRIVVTDLYNKAFPMIRYDTGDVARMNVKGLNSLPEFSELYGRRMDLIYDTNGEVVSPFLLCRTMRLSHGIEQWQFIQKDVKKYEIRIAVTHGENPDLKKEIELFIETLGKDAEILVECVSEIPVMNSLKRKLIVSELK